MIDDISPNATYFAAALIKVAKLADVELSTAIRKGVLDLFGNIILRSPVDTGAYRASHTIANFNPVGGEGIVPGVKGGTIPESIPLEKGANWTWKVGDGDIFIFNNLPYAERIENGWSSPSGGGRSVVKAPAGVYSVALAEIAGKIHQALSGMTVIEPGPGE